MTYAARETSQQDGRPNELYEFERLGQFWRYTSSDRSVSDSGTFQPEAISRTPIESTQELARAPITIKVRRDLPVIDDYRMQPPQRAIHINIRQRHDGDSGGSLTVVVYTGRVVAVTWAGSEAEIHCEPTIMGLERLGLRRFWQRQCPHVLYGTECGLDKTAHRVVGPIDVINGNTVEISEAALQPDGWYAGGFIERELPSSIAFENRFIVSHTGVVLTLNAPLYSGFSVGQNHQIYKGCDHTAATCDSKFGNLANYGGFEYMVTKNPFGSAPIY